MMKLKDKILWKINEKPGLVSIELSEEFLKSKASISIYLKKLEEEELIVKHLSEENKKKFRIHPTKKGKEVYLKLKLKMIDKV